MTFKIQHVLCVSNSYFFKGIGPMIYSINYIPKRVEQLQWFMETTTIPIRSLAEGKMDGYNTMKFYEYDEIQ